LKLDKNQGETNLPMKILFSAYFTYSSGERSMANHLFYVQKLELSLNSWRYAPSGYGCGATGSETENCQSLQPAPKTRRVPAVRCWYGWTLSAFRNLLTNGLSPKMPTK
jgi:hypothetical protein